MHQLDQHAEQMRRRVYQHMLEKRGWKFQSFIRYLRLFKYAALAPTRGALLESYYTLMRYLDDVVDGDAPLPDVHQDASAYITEKLRFSRFPDHPQDDVDYLMRYCFELASKIGTDFSAETTDILTSLLFDAKRRGRLMIFSEEALIHHFHLLDIRGTIRATLKIFKEDPEKYPLLEPLGTASRYQFDLEDFESDIAAGYVNISQEECARLGIRREDLHNPRALGIQKWFRLRAEAGLALLEEHHRRMPEGKFSLLSRVTFYLVYELPARKVFRKILSESTKTP